jgi:glycosyltransferase involved in cell wall biosynthesis
MQYPDVQILGMDPTEHYLRYGWLLGRKPSAGFDPQKYADPDGTIGWRNPVLVALDNGAAQCQASVVEVADAVYTQKKQEIAPAQSSLADYELIVTEFDREYYLRRYQDIARADVDPAMHFLKNGGFELRNPNPDFDTKFYVTKYPDVKAAKINPFLHYLREGRAQGRSPSPLSVGTPHFDHVAGMLDLAPQVLQDILQARKKDIRARLESGELGDMCRKAAELDPLIQHAWLSALTIGISPIRTVGLTHQVAAMHRLQEFAGWRRAKVAVLVPWVHVSGAARVAGYLATALAKLYDPDDIIVIRTETSEFEFPEWFPQGCRQIDFAAETQGMEESLKERLLVEFLRSLRLDHVFNVNSRTFWNALESFGVALSKSISLHTYLFCNEKNIYGDWVGYPVRYYHKFADILQSVICDSQFLADELSDRFFVTPQHLERLHVLATPINGRIQAVTPARRLTGARPRVYWAGRFDRQKRVDVAYAIAEKMPDVDFHFWGKPTLDKGFEKLKKPDNVTLEGIYREFEELPLARCDAWLYTAEWDGVPNILLDVASAAIPLVGSIAGGTSAVLIEGLSQPVAEIENIDAYVSALRYTINKPEQARASALALRDHIMIQRSDAVYQASVKALLGPGVD